MPLFTVSVLISGPPPSPSSELVLDSTCQGFPAAVPSYPPLPRRPSPPCPKAVKGCHRGGPAWVGFHVTSCPRRGSVYLGRKEAVISERLSQSPVS